MDLALNSLQRLICHKNQTKKKQKKIIIMKQKCMNKKFVQPKIQSKSYLTTNEFKLHIIANISYVSGTLETQLNINQILSIENSIRKKIKVHLILKSITSELFF